MDYLCKKKWILASVLLLFPALGFAHNPFASVNTNTIPIFISAGVLFISWSIYQIGTLRLHPLLIRWVIFQFAIVITAFTIFGPFDEWAETSTAMHMNQHMMLLMVISPLYVLARPLPQYYAVLGRVVSWIWLPILRITHYPLLTAGLQMVVIWFWHSPKFYMLALNHPWWHVFEHFTFLFTSFLFWWSILLCTPKTAPRAFLALLLTLMHTGFLGALLTFAHSSMYGAGRSLESQQLAGLIMWVLGSFPYFIGSFWCGIRWFQHIQNPV